LRPNFSFDTFEIAVWEAVHFKRRNKPLEIFTIGSTRKRHILFLDLDTKNLDLYKTKDGYHLTAKMTKPFDYLFRRLRVSAKIKNGKIVNPKPKLVFCSCPNRIHVDKRFNRLEIYGTATK
jgi:hypothetical protein